MYEIVFDGFEADKPEKTYYVGNYYEHKIVGIKSPPDQLNAVTAEYMLYFPIVHQERETVVTSYYYADGERIAMKSDGIVYYLFSDHLGSTTSVVARDTGEEISHQLYHPWGTTRYSYPGSGEQATDYGYTGQMQVDDIYYYNARWYDPMLGRFMQADTLVPSHQGTQGFDRYAYVNNNPVNGTDPTGMWMCGDMYDPACAQNKGELDNYNEMAGIPKDPRETPTIIYVGGVNDADAKDQFKFYRGIYGFEEQFFDPDRSNVFAKKADTADRIIDFFNNSQGTVYMICYSAGAGACASAYTRLSPEEKFRVAGIGFLDGYPDAYNPVKGEDEDFSLQMDLFQQQYNFRFYSNISSFMRNASSSPLSHPNVVNDDSYSEELLSELGLWK